MGNRLDKDKEAKLQPIRLEYAITELRKAGYEPNHQGSTKVQFEHNGSTVILFAYSGWFTGKSVKDGRGINNLLKQLKRP
jgi:hypothetical protein